MGGAMEKQLLPSEGRQLGCWKVSLQFGGLLVKLDICDLSSKVPLPKTFAQPIFAASVLLLGLWAA